ncbi:MAG: hypothetical protein Q4B31_01550 [Clostridia bacterium]|nr:hypothetical protein [Clostridia bacterium]
MLMLFTPTKKKEPDTETASVYSESESLKKIISGIKGSGKCDVMVTYYGSGVENIVFDTKTRNGETDKTAVLSDGKAVSQGTSYPRVKGVVVVSSGAENSKVRSEILNAVCTALDIPEYKVAVIEG